MLHLFSSTYSQTRPVPHQAHRSPALTPPQSPIHCVSSPSIFIHENTSHNITRRVSKLIS